MNPLIKFSAPDGNWKPSDLMSRLKEIMLDKEPDEYLLFTSFEWDRFMDNDYPGSKPLITLRNQIPGQTGIRFVISAKWLKGYDMMLLTMNQALSKLRYLEALP
jgi:hypothetical protein